MSLSTALGITETLVLGTPDLRTVFSLPVVSKVKKVLKLKLQEIKIWKGKVFCNGPWKVSNYMNGRLSSIARTSSSLSFQAFKSVNPLLHSSRIEYEWMNQRSHVTIMTCCCEFKIPEQSNLVTLNMNKIAQNNARAQKLFCLDPLTYF